MSVCSDMIVRNSTQQEITMLDSKNPWINYSELIYDYYENMSTKYYDQNKVTISSKEFSAGRELYITTYNISRNTGYPW